MQPGDIIAVRGKKLLSRLISDFSGPISHVGAVTSLSPTMVTQALTTVETISLADTLAAVQYAYCLQPLGLSDSQRMSIVTFLATHVGESYDYADLAWQAADILARTDYFTERFASDGRVICSELVAQAYGSIGLNFGVSQRSATPTEIYDYAIAHPAKYAVSRIAG